MVTFVQLLSGRACLGFASFAELVESREAVLACELAVLDVNLGAGQPSGLDAYEWLKREGFAGRVVFLTGHAPSHPLVQRAHRLGDARVFAKPITSEELRSLIDWTLA